MHFTLVYLTGSYGDMRVTMSTLMLTKWRMLGHLHTEFMPDIVGPFLKISLMSQPGKQFGDCFIRDIYWYICSYKKEHYFSVL